MTDQVVTPGSEKRRRNAFRRWLSRNSVSMYALCLMILLGCVAIAPRMLVTVPAGHVGVLWLRFMGGTVTDYHYDEGIHFVFPWDEVIVYDVRLRNSARVYDTISSDGLRMQVEIAVRYRVNRESVGFLHKLVGPDYPQVLVYPEIGSHARELIATYTPEQLYTNARSFIQAQILERMVRELGSSLANQSYGGRLVTVEDVLIRSVMLPDAVAEAIERKSQQYHAMLEYDYRIEREKKERERKKIEAEGVREFQDIVSHTITPEYLRLRGIEATMALATSQNSKTIIIGGKDGLPVILNTEDNRPPQPAPAPAAAASDDIDSHKVQPPNAAPDAGDSITAKEPEPDQGTDLTPTLAPPAPGAAAPPTPSAAVAAPDGSTSEDSSQAPMDSMDATPDSSATPRD